MLFDQFKLIFRLAHLIRFRVSYSFYDVYDFCECIKKRSVRESKIHRNNLIGIRSKTNAQSVSLYLCQLMASLPPLLCEENIYFRSARQRKNRLTKKRQWSSVLVQRRKRHNEKCASGFSLLLLCYPHTITQTLAQFTCKATSFCVHLHTI